MFILASRLYAEEHKLSAEALFSFGEAYLKENRYDDAKTELRKCLMLNPNHQGAKQILQQIEGKPVKPEEKPVKFTKNESREKAIKLALEDLEKKIKSKTETPVIAPQEKQTPAPLKELEKVAKEKETKPKEVTKEPEKTAEEKSLPYIGGAWGVPKKHCLLELYSKYYYHNSQFDNQGKKKRWGYGGKGSEIQNEFKIDYGLSDNITVWVHIPFKEAYWKDDYNKSKTKGFGDIWLGGKYRFLDNPLVLSLALASKFPAGYNANDSPSLGNGQFDQEIMLLSAKAIHSFYFRAESGYRWRNEEPADLIPYFLEIGYEPWDRILLKTDLDGVKSISGTGNVEDYTKGVICILFTLRRGVNPFTKTKDQLGIELGYGETFIGKNASAASEVYTKILYYF